MEIVDLPCSLRDLNGDLRDPLTAILGLTSILKDDPMFTSEQRTYLKEQYLNGLQSSGEAIKVVVDKLLAAKKV